MEIEYCGAKGRDEIPMKYFLLQKFNAFYIFYGFFWLKRLCVLGQS